MPAKGGHYRAIATATRDHLRDHITDYLTAAAIEVGIQPPPVPVRTDVSSFVGGVVGLDPHKPQQFPAIALNANSRIHDPSNADLYTYRYDGQIAGVVMAGDPQTTEDYATIYVSALEAFIQEHVYQPVDNSFDLSLLPFKFVEFGFIRSEFFGVVAVEAEGQKGRNVRNWYEPFRIEIAWVISEDGTGQHDT